MGTEDIYLYAIYEDIYYTVTFKDYDGTVLKVEEDVYLGGDALLLRHKQDSARKVKH